MSNVILVVPRGPESAAVRRARPAARVIDVPAARASAATLPVFAPNDIVVVLGLAGALRGPHVGDVVIYRSVSDDSRRFTLDPAIAMELLGQRLNEPIIVDACTTDHVVTMHAERATLAARWNADVVDMEGTYLAAALFARSVRFAMVRVISDDATREIPALANAITADGGVNVAQIALAFIRAPRAAFAFIRNVRTALRRLTQVTAALGHPDPSTSSGEGPPQ